MKKGILFLILFFLVVCKGTGQILQGYVKTLEEKPVSQAHVILLNSDLKVVAHAVSGDDGFFLITSVKKGITLDEVIVIKHKKFLTTKVDRIIYDMEQDSMAKNSVAMQILEKLPFVDIDLKTK